MYLCNDKHESACFTILMLIRVTFLTSAKNIVLCTADSTFVEPDSLAVEARSTDRFLP